MGMPTKLITQEQICLLKGLLCPGEPRAQPLVSSLHAPSVISSGLLAFHARAPGCRRGFSLSSRFVNPRPPSLTSPRACLIRHLKMNMTEVN